MGEAALRGGVWKRACRPVSVGWRAVLPGDCVMPGYEIAGAPPGRAGLPPGADIKRAPVGGGGVGAATRVSRRATEFRRGGSGRSRPGSGSSKNRR